MTNANIRFQPSHIDFTIEDVMLEGNSIHLLADISKPITIEPNRFAVVPTAVFLNSDNNGTVGLIEVHAGRAQPDEHTVLTGAFIIPPQNGESRVDVTVVNMTGATVVIHPRVSIGVLSFREVAQPTHEDIRQGGHDVDMPAIYEPQHIDPTITPAYSTEGSSGFDLRADLAKEHVLQPGERMMVPTGLRMAIPVGLEGQIRPRSGLASREGVAAILGTIDADYRGEIKIVLLNNGQKPFTVVPAERVAQFVIAPVVKAAMNFGGTLDETERGEGGFGSTGRK